MKQDEIVTDELVIAADGWREAGYAAAQAVEIEGKTGVFLPESGQLRIPFPQTQMAQGEYNQLVLEIYFPEAMCVWITLETDVISPGLEEKDVLHSMSCAYQPGWRRVSMPLANFIPCGMSNDFANAARICLQPDSAGMAVGEMRMQVVRQPEGPRMTDEEFLAELDLDRPELAQVKAAREQGDLDAALAALDEHFRTRTTPEHFYFDIIPDATSATIAEADRLCEGYIQDYYRPGEIDWRGNPNGYVEWPIHLQYMSWNRALISAYRTTGDEKYARRQDEIISSHIRHNPRPIGHRGGLGGWAPHRPSSRLTRCWPWTFFSMLDSPSFQQRTRLDMLKTWWEMVEHTLEWSLPDSANFGWTDTLAIYRSGILFPEFKRSAFWREEGLTRLHEELERQFHPDGAQYELAGYHEGCMQRLFNVYRLAQFNEIDLGDDFKAALNRMLDYSMHRVRPCGTVVSHNDAGGYLHVARADNGNNHVMARELGREDARFIFEGEGTIPAESSKAFPYTGMYFMRGGWAPEDLCLFFDGASIGRGHRHEDKLSIDVSGYGKEFIVDPGIHSYMADRFRDYMNSSYAHSTIHVDGKPQNRIGRQTLEQTVRDVIGENQWYTGDVFDYARSQYDAGYGEPQPDEGPQPVHHRAVIFVRGDYFLVFDYVEGEGHHKVESMLHFAPMPVFIDEEQATFRTFNQSPANLEVICLPGPPRPGMSVICGQNDPVQGWVALGWGHPAPAPVAIMTWERELPLLAGMLLIPYKEGRSAQLQVENLLCEGSAWAGQVNWPDGRHDLILLRFDGEDEVKLDGLHTDARVAVVRMNAEGEVIATDYYGGTYLEVN